MDWSQVSARVEDIFSHAVALHQSGRLRNTIYCVGSRVLILNCDHTVLMSFKLRSSEVSFSAPISFKADDYDSKYFREEDGKIVFLKEEAGFTRSKKCIAPSDALSPEAAVKLFDSYSQDLPNTIRLSSGVTALLEESLSHIEVQGIEGKAVFVQRNIYSGTVLEITRAEEEGLAVVSNDNIAEDFGPIGLRTPDFLSLFSFCDQLEFRFAADEAEYSIVKSMDPKIDMTVVLAGCRYDEMESITETNKGGKTHGRQKPQNRSPKPGVDQPPEEESTSEGEDTVEAPVTRSTRRR